MIELFPDKTLYYTDDRKKTDCMVMSEQALCTEREQIMLPIMQTKKTAPSQEKAQQKRQDARREDRVQTMVNTGNAAVRRRKQYRATGSNQIMQVKKKNRELKWFLYTVAFCCMFFAMLISARIICNNEEYNASEPQNIYTTSDDNNEVSDYDMISVTEPYKEVVIRNGDSLWSIAKENMSPGCHSVNEMVDSISMYNHLEDSRIYAGQILKIPCGYAIADNGI